MLECLKLVVYDIQENHPFKFYILEKNLFTEKSISFVLMGYQYF